MTRLKFTAILFALFFTACRPEPAIFGTWQSEDGNSIWQFHIDGSFTLDEPGASLSGTYLILDDRFLEITFAQYDQTLEPQLFEFNLTRDILTISSPAFGSHEYRRLPD